MSLADFRKAIHCLSIFGLDSKAPGHTRELERLRLARSICERAYGDVPSVMTRVRSSFCFDPRDKIYGSLGIIKLAGESRLVETLTVDYSPSHSVEAAYLDFFKRYHKRYDTLGLLAHAGLSGSAEMRPTWVPDWRVQPVELDYSIESATSHFVRGECSYPSSGVLAMLGRLVTALTSAHSLAPPGPDESSIDRYRELGLLLHGTTLNLHASTSVQRLTRAICSPLSGSLYDLESVRRRREEIVGYVQYICEMKIEHLRDRTKPFLPPEQMLSPEATSALEICVRFLRQPGLPLIFASHDLVGVGPKGAQAGDVVSAVLGSRALLLLRPADGGAHRLVGPCFVHGYNWGEALLGPLPGKCIVVPYYEASRRGYVPHYLDPETNVSTMWDPRVRWEELDVQPALASFVPVTAPPCEPLRMRPDSDYLRRHDVELDEIKLI
ncbi:hypothetical protein LTR85_002418 [Meristemomyces frigidus]|nr:hypothetical protein LTR85_002418 [Meristemomyces frigidus]